MAAVRVFIEWTCESSLKPYSGVDADGSPIRYQQGMYDST